MPDRTITLTELDRIGRGMPDLTVRHLSGILLTVADILPPRTEASAPVPRDDAGSQPPASIMPVIPAAPERDGPVRPYTAAEVQTMLKRRAAGKGWAEIAMELGRSPESCRARYHKERCQEARTRRPPKLWTVEEDDTLRNLWTAGEVMSAIAEALGRTDKAIQVRRARLGLPPRGTCIGAGPVPVDGPSGPGRAEAVQPVVEDTPVKAAELEAVTKDREAAAPGQPGPKNDPDPQPRPVKVQPVLPAAIPSRATPVITGDRKHQINAIVSALMQLDESFEPTDDLHLITQRFKGRHWDGIAAQLGCDEPTAKGRWRAILGCKVAHKGGIVTAQGWSDLMAAARIVAGDAS